MSHEHHAHHGQAPAGGDHGHGAHVHVMPLSVLFAIFTLLIVFTAMTVVIAQFHLGKWEVPITMLIATTKATLVAVYFMHLRYDNPFNAMIFVFSLLFVGLFLGGALMDVGQYQDSLIPPVVQDAPAAAAPAK